jgi:hypothetical protein
MSSTISIETKSSAIEVKMYSRYFVKLTGVNTESAMARKGKRQMYPANEMSSLIPFKNIFIIVYRSKTEVEEVW